MHSSRTCERKTLDCSRKYSKNHAPSSLDRESTSKKSKTLAPLDPIGLQHGIHKSDGSSGTESSTKPRHSNVSGSERPLVVTRDYGGKKSSTAVQKKSAWTPSGFPWEFSKLMLPSTPSATITSA